LITLTAELPQSESFCRGNITGHVGGGSAYVPQEDTMQLIDLSFTIENGMPVYPGDIETNIVRLTTPKIVEAGWLAHNATLSFHAGTHIESSAHSIKGGKTLDEYPLESFCGEVTTIDWDEIGKQPVSTPLLFIHSGFDRLWGDEKYFSPTHLTGDQAEWIGAQGIKVLGTDIISVGDLATHAAIQGKDILLVESLCNLDVLLHKRAKAYLFPLKVNVEASPVRAVAELL
jgi:kynurenine formamidase